METYIKINGAKIPLKDIAAKFGIHGPIEKAAVCQEVSAGTLVATATGLMTDPYPAIDVELVLPEEADSCPIGIARVEQPYPDDKPEDVTAYLYGRGDEYIAYMHVDARPDFEEEEHPLPPSITLSGNPGEVVQFSMENGYVEFCGNQAV